MIHTSKSIIKERYKSSDFKSVSVLNEGISIDDNISSKSERVKIYTKRKRYIPPRMRAKY